MNAYKLEYSYYCGSKEKKENVLIIAESVQMVKDKVFDESKTMYERYIKNGKRIRKTLDEKWLEIAANVKYIGAIKLPFVLKSVANR